ncbi:MAG: glycosyltransferase [Ilumatobacter sp.]|nr:glycosyltransferase [Ilumatobacter sp.]
MAGRVIESDSRERTAAAQAPPWVQHLARRTRRGLRSAQHTAHATADRLGPRAVRWWRDQGPFALCIATPIAFAGVLAVVVFGLGEYHGQASWHGNGRVVWMSSAAVALVNLAGLLLYGSPEPANRRAMRRFRHVGWSRNRRLAVVYVSRGTNVRALQRSVDRTTRLLEQMNVRYHVFVVTDIDVSLTSEVPSTLHHHVVPENYVTPNGAQYKARALEYLLRHALDRLRKKGTWLLHLDEESQLHPSAVAGIAKFVDNPRNARRIGQGEIKYNSMRYGRNPLVTAIDAIRTGDDLGRFRLQYKLLGAPLFGMHGSYILVPLHIESAIGFDLGGKGSITEDAYFALISSQRYEFGWVDGYVREQSPFSVKELVLQRRRWFNGLLLLSLDRTLRLRIRLPLIVAMACWAVSWLSPLMIIVSLVLTGTLPMMLFVMATVTQGSFAAIYVIGAYRNLRDLDPTPLGRASMLVLPVLLMPISAVIEAAAVVYALIRPVSTFDIIDKDQTAPTGLRRLHHRDRPGAAHRAQPAMRPRRIA